MHTLYLLGENLDMFIRVFLVSNLNALRAEDPKAERMSRYIFTIIKYI